MQGYIALHYNRMHTVSYLQLGHSAIHMKLLPLNYNYVYQVY